MSWLYLREVGVVSSEASLVDSEPSARSSGTPTAKPFSWPGKLTASWNASRYGTTCEPSKEPNGVEKSTSLPQVFLANLSVLPANEKVKVMTETDGLTPSESYGRWDQDSHCWKTSQACLIGMEDVTSEKYLESFPKAGLMQDGRLFQRLKLEPRIGAIGSGLWLTPRAQETGENPANFVKRMGDRNSTKYGSLSSQVMWPTPMLPGNGGTNGKAKLKRMLNFPTPRAQDGPHGPARGSLGDVVRWATPIKRDCRTLKGAKRSPNALGTEPLVVQVGGQLNPPWVEWLMGWPIGWTDLKPLGTDRWQEWRQAHGGY